MIDHLAAALQSLREQETLLQAERVTLREKVRETDTRLKQVRSSIKALADVPRPVLSDADAEAFVVSRVEAEGQAAKPDLQQALLEHAKSLGCSGTGLHLVLRRVLKSERFDVRGEQVKLAAAS